MTAGPVRPALRLTAAWVAAKMRGTLEDGEAARLLGDVSIDSRTVTPGDLFIAIRGEQFNGALFAATDAAAVAAASRALCAAAGRSAE